MRADGADKVGGRADERADGRTRAPSGQVDGRADRRTCGRGLRAGRQTGGRADEADGRTGQDIEASGSAIGRTGRTVEDGFPKGKTPKLTRQLTWPSEIQCGRPRITV